MPAVVLTYHRVADGRDPLQQAVRPPVFEDQLDRLARLVDVLPLGEARHARRGRAVALTFDDGYSELASVVLTALRKRRLPATFFVTHGRDTSEFWWDALEHIVLDAPASAKTVDLCIAGRPFFADIRSCAARARTLKALNHRLRILPGTDIATVLEELRAQTGHSPPHECSLHARMTPADIAALAAEPLVEIGAHGASHTMLSAIGPREQQKEIERSRDALEAVTGAAPTRFAYPYGTPDSYTQQTQRLLRCAGFELACVNTPGVVTRRSDQFALPRLMVYDTAGATFEQRLRDAFRPR